MQRKVLSAETQSWSVPSAFPLEFVQLDDGVDLGRLALAALADGESTLADWIDAMLALLSSRQGVLLDACSFVARSRTGLLGASLVVLRDGEPWLTHLMVLPEHRRQGLGTALLAATLSGLQRAQYPVVHALRANDAGSAFLTRRHFTQRPDPAD